MVCKQGRAYVADTLDMPASSRSRGSDMQMVGQPSIAITMVLSDAKRTRREAMFISE